MGQDLVGSRTRRNLVMTAVVGLVAALLVSSGWSPAAGAAPGGGSGGGSGPPAETAAGPHLLGEITPIAAGLSNSTGAIATRPDGFQWVVHRGGAQIVRFDPATGTRAGVIGSSLGAMDMALGPDGNMWVTSSSSRIARITPAGVVTWFSHASISQPDGIVAGPD